MHICIQTTVDVSTFGKIITTIIVSIHVIYCSLNNLKINFCVLVTFLNNK